MYIKFYKVTPDARNDYRELCPLSNHKITTEYPYDCDKQIAELNRKIRRCANLGKIVQSDGTFETIHYWNMLFLIKDYTVVCIEKTDMLEPYAVDEKTKFTYDKVEEKLTKKRYDKENIN